jgi:hypothetical protein
VRIEPVEPERFFALGRSVLEHRNVGARFRQAGVEQGARGVDAGGASVGLDDLGSVLHQFDGAQAGTYFVEQIADPVGALGMQGRGQWITGRGRGVIEGDRDFHPGFVFDL